jgi:DNA-binding CsgD family transcriptional regulator
MQVKEYALYKGEELLAIGTKREIAEQLGVSVNSVSHYGTPVYARRTSENGRGLVKL